MLIEAADDSLPACLKMDFLWGSAEMIPAGYLKGKSATELSDDSHKYRSEEFNPTGIMN